MRLPVDDDFHFMLPLIAKDRLWITSNERLFWAERARRVKAWRTLSAWTAKERHIPRIEKAYIVCDFHFGDKRRRDPSNWADTAKAIIDGLVDADVFEDDNFKYVIGPDVRIGAVVPKQFRGVDVRIYPMNKRKRTR